MSIVVTEDRGPVRHVVLNRPEKRNAMNQELLRALAAALRAAGDEEAVQCVVLRGEGPVFSAGVDLAELASLAGDTSVRRSFRNVFLDCANLCETMTKPVVCQIHRTCVGGALEVALGCDLRIASSDAQLGLPEVKFGIIPDVGGSTRLPAVVGLGRAKELIMTAQADRRASEAERIGLVNRVVAPERAGAARRRRSCEELLANSPVAVGRVKRVLDASARPALAQTLEMEIAVQEYCVARRARELARLSTDAPTPWPALGAAAPVDRSGQQRVAAERAPEDLLHAACARDQRGQVDARRDPHLMQHRNEILGGDVACRPGRNRAATQLAEARLEALHPGLERGQHIGEALAAGVVEVRRQLDAPRLAMRVPRRRSRRPAAGWPCRWCRRSRSPERPRREVARRSRARARAARGPHRGSRTRSRSPPRSAARRPGRGPAPPQGPRATPRSSG